MRIPALLALIAAAACTDLAPARVDVPVDSAAGEVAFTLAGPGGAALIVPVHINGRGPYDFVLDTGATVTCLNEALSNELALERVRGVVGTAAGVSGQGRLQLVNVDSLRIGHAAAHDLHACVVDLQHLEGAGLDIDGLVGLNVMTNFRITLDFQRNVVTFSAP
jgi:predicted aspartyl protease